MTIRRVLGVFVVAAAACSSESDKGAETGMKVGLVVDGVPDDNTYNRRVLDGCLNAAIDFDLDFDHVVTENGDYLAKMQTYADEGYKHVVSVSFLSAEATMQAAMA